MKRMKINCSDTHHKMYKTIYFKNIVYKISLLLNFAYNFLRYLLAYLFTFYISHYISIFIFYDVYTN